MPSLQRDGHIAQRIPVGRIFNAADDGGTGAELSARDTRRQQHSNDRPEDEPR